MKSINQLIRLLHINLILARNGLDHVVVSTRLFSPFRFIVWLNPWNWSRRKKITRGEAIRKTLEELGPLFVKLGQALSTRPDILPPDIAVELCKLQDNVPPFKSDQALAMIQSVYGRPAHEVFAEFDAQPLASASIAQVHAATLKTGEKVVVKLLRPNLDKIIQRDLNIMYTLANLAEKYWAESQRFKPREVVQEFEHNLLNELDLQREAANATQLRRNFQNSPLLYIPDVFWDYTHKNILVMERIYGIPVSDIETLNNQQIDVKKLAERGVQIFFKQVFEDCFFHADMHPGNIFVSPNHRENPQYLCVDFGIIGTLNESDKRYLAENLYAFFNQDYRRVAQLHVESGWVSRNIRIEDLEGAIRTVCEPIFKKPLKDISFAQIILKLFQVAREFEMTVQPQLILLQKTLFAIEGLGRQLYPELNLWMTAKPFLEKWLKEQIGPKAFFRRLKETLPYLSEELPYLPHLLFETLSLIKEEKRRKLIPLKRKEMLEVKQWRLKGFFLGVIVSFLSLGVYEFVKQQLTGS